MNDYYLPLNLSEMTVQSRQGTPMTNYGIVIAHLKGILGKVSLP